MSGAAAKDVLEKLHTEVARVLLNAITQGCPILLPNGDPVLVDGQPVIGPAPAALINQARQFLKDNDIKALLVPGSPLDQLGKTLSGVTLPFEGDSATH